MSPLSIAIVGGGHIGKRHLKVLVADSAYRTAAIADPSPAAAALAKEHGVPYFTDYERMLDEARPDGVIIAVPNALHVAVGLACIEHKIPALVEKPLADSLVEARQLVHAAKEANVALLTGHHRRHNPIMAVAAKAIQSGAVGKVTAVNAMWLSHKPADYFDIAWRREPGEGWHHPLTRKRIPYVPEDAYVAQMRNFAQVIAGEDAPVMSGEEGLRTLASTLAIAASAKTGQPVRVADVLKNG